MSASGIDTSGTAIVAKRADPGEDPDPGEIRALAEAAGFAVAGAVTQTRPEDTGTNLGSGKVEELVEAVEDEDADAVVVDDQLTPGQTLNLSDRLPPETQVIDRYRLILAVFADQAGDKRATLQMELARLRYEMPRIERASDGQFLNKLVEKGTWLHQAEDRVDELQNKLDDLNDAAAQHRQQRREEGFDLVALAGYTNAGKSTLLHRLADDLSLESAEPDHPDQEGTAEIEDRLFKTLETTTRRATLGGRRVMLTDTVGFVDDLPHDLVESFSATIDEIGAADVVVLVVDASDSQEAFESKLSTSLDVVSEADPRETVVALNKADLVDAATLDDRRAAVPDDVAATVATSATDDEGMATLRERVRDALPSEYATATVPNCDAAMGLVSWAYENGQVIDVEYGDSVEIEFVGRPTAVEKLRSKADAIGEGSPEKEAGAA